jgi:hypothetical protein
MSDIGIWLALVIAFAGGLGIGAYMMHGYMTDRERRP